MGPRDGGEGTWMVEEKQGDDGAFFRLKLVCWAMVSTEFTYVVVLALIQFVVLADAPELTPDEDLVGVMRLVGPGMLVLSLGNLAVIRMLHDRWFEVETFRERLDTFRMPPRSTSSLDESTPPLVHRLNFYLTQRLLILYALASAPGVFGLVLVLIGFFVAPLGLVNSCLAGLLMGLAFVTKVLLLPSRETYEELMKQVS